MVLFFKFVVLFVIYSIMGWLFEVVVMFFHTKQFNNRGFLIGPYCPIYGTAALLMILFLKKYENDLLVLFIMSILICSITEYVTSYLLEKMFKARWWDYTENRFNINGRICLSDSVIFGFLGVLLIYYINPFFNEILSHVFDTLIILIGSTILIVFIIDMCLSFNIIRKIKLSSTNERKDYTNEISALVRNRLATKSVLVNRIFRAFPNLKFIKNNK